MDELLDRLWEHQGPKKKRNSLWGTVTDISREDTEPLTSDKDRYFREDGAQGF